MRQPAVSQQSKNHALDLSKQGDLSKIESALSIYYNHLIEYVIENIKQESLLRREDYRRLRQAHKHHLIGRHFTAHRFLAIGLNRF